MRRLGQETPRPLALDSCSFAQAVAPVNAKPHLVAGKYFSRPFLRHPVPPILLNVFLSPLGSPCSQTDVSRKKSFSCFFSLLSATRTVPLPRNLLLQVGENTSLCRRKWGTSKNPKGLQTGRLCLFSLSCLPFQDRINIRSYLFGIAKFLQEQT